MVFFLCQLLRRAARHTIDKCSYSMSTSRIVYKTLEELPEQFYYGKIRTGTPPQKKNSVWGQKLTFLSSSSWTTPRQLWQWQKKLLPTTWKNMSLPWPFSANTGRVSNLFSFSDPPLHRQIVFINWDMLTSRIVYKTLEMLPEQFYYRKSRTGTPPQKKKYVWE